MKCLKTDRCYFALSVLCPRKLFKRKMYETFMACAEEAVGFFKSSSDKRQFIVLFEELAFAKRARNIYISNKFAVSEFICACCLVETNDGFEIVEMKQIRETRYSIK